MKAILDHDVIVRLSERGQEIGEIPQGIGLERLRFDGERVVDLSGLSEIWVTRINGVWSLHAVEIPGTQLVSMTYRDRKHLKNDGGVYRLMTAEEIAAAAAAAEQNKADAVNSREAVGTFISGFTYAEVNDHIETVFGGLTPAQKNSLKFLYRIVLWLAKRSI